VTPDDPDLARRVASLQALFCPAAVAVIGASRDPAAIGHRVFAALRAGFRGPVYPVNAMANEIDGVRAWPSVHDLARPVDLAVVTTPRDAVLPVLQQCGACGVKAVVVITAGFSECGPEGAVVQERIRETARAAGMRLVGPNCLGVINADPAVRLNASFAPLMPEPGNIAMSSQSGGLGIALLAAARRNGLGVSIFVSVGNKADVSGNDLLEYWEQDLNTGVILLYVESFGNPRRFARVARRVGRSKPIIAIKGGRSAAGGRAAGSHTAALAAKEIAVDALFCQSGVIRVETLEELFDVAAVLAHQPLPAGPRVGIITNAGGPAILAADACEAAGLTVPPLSSALQKRLAEFLPRGAGLGNPVDMIAAAGPAEFRATITEVLSSGEVDALIALYVSVGSVPTAEVTAAIREGVDCASAGRPVVACLTVPGAEPVRVIAGSPPLPAYNFPEEAARALGRAAKYAAWKHQPLGAIPEFRHGFAPVRVHCQAVLTERGSGWLSAEETRRLLDLAGFVHTPGGIATTADEAVRLAKLLDGPVAVKLVSRSLLHKSDVGGVRLNLIGPDSVRLAFHSIREAVERLGKADAFEGVIVQPMVPDGVEVVVGMTQDPLFGPLVMFGLGGVFVEVLADVCFRITPLTDRDAAEMVRSIKGFRLLEGYRGHPRCDVAAVEELLLRLSGLVEAVPEVAELDFNPVMALPAGRGTVIVDARVRVASI